VRCTSFKIETPTTDAASTITIRFHDGSSTVINFYQSGAIEYQFSQNDEQIGKITSASYQKLIRSIKELADTAKGE
ncbi:MAG: hypothetical protein IJZ63_06145, partial [Clostridia bacterium]|nr:hypothetical protein [Clostridia bacterium]